MDVGASALPIYEPAEAARLAGLSREQVSRWLFGYGYRYRHEHRRQGPLMQRRAQEGSSKYASFLDLVELRAAKLFLDHGLSPQKVRRAFLEAERVSGPYAFASRPVYVAGPRLFLELKAKDGMPNLLELQTGGQWVIEPLMRELLHQLDFDRSTGHAETWWPLGRKKPVVISPRQAFGAPTLSGHNIKTANIYDLFLAEGRNAAPVARWFDIEPRDVGAAVEYEEALARPKAA